MHLTMFCWNSVLVQAHWRSSLPPQHSEEVKHLVKQGVRDGIAGEPEEVGDWALTPRAAMAARTTTRVEIMSGIRRS